jgi:KaiC/GvpD/RAD55 family RecA-like ATPase
VSNDSWFDDVAGEPEPQEPEYAENVEPQGKPLPVWRPSQLKDRKPAKPIIEGLLYAGTMAQISGPPGSYKSFITIGMACAVATQQRGWEGFKVKGGNVIYIAAEGGHGLWIRMAAWCIDHGIDPAELDEKLWVVDQVVSLNQERSHTGIKPYDPHGWLNETIALAKDNDVSLVIFDTRHRCTPGLEENSATEMGRAIAEAERIVSETGATVLMVHHSAKSGVGGRGSNSWDGAIWTNLVLATKEKMCATINVEKHKDAPDGMDHHFTMKLVTLPQEWMPNATEQQRVSLVAIASDGSAPIGGNGVTENERIILRMIQDAGSIGLTRSELVSELAGKIGSSGVYKAIDRLTADGAIFCPDPKKRGARWTVAQDTLGL